MKVKYYNKETFEKIDNYQIVNESRVRLIYPYASKNTSGFDIYDDKETLILSYPLNTVVYDIGDDFVEYTTDQNIYCIHYMYNNEGYITGQYRSLEDVVDGCIFVDKGQGKKYAEDEAWIKFVDAEGFYNYEVVNGKVVEVTEEEKAVVRARKESEAKEDAKLSFEINRENKIKESKVLLAQYLETHPMSSDCHGGAVAEYNVTAEKQQLMASNYLTYTIAKQSGIENPVLTWNASGCECEEWTEEEFVTLVLQISQYVKPLVSLQQSYEVAIKNCTTQEELDAVNIVYNVYGVAE